MRGKIRILKKNLNASKPSEHPLQVEECLKVGLGGNIGYRDKTSSWYQKKGYFPSPSRLYQQPFNTRYKIITESRPDG